MTEPTAPTTSWAVPPRGWTGGWVPDAEEPARPRLPRALARDVLVGVPVLALLVAGLWVWLAPDVAGRVVEGGAVLDADQAANVFGREAVLALLLGAAGVLLAAVVFTRHRAHGVAAAVLLTLGGLVGAVGAWRVGLLLGPPAVESVTGLAVGATVPVPLRLETTGLLVAWPVMSLVVVLLLNAWLEDPRPPSGPPRHAAGISRDEPPQPSSPPSA